MKALLEKPMKIFAAAALAIGLGTSAMANDDQVASDGTNVEAVSLEQGGYSIATAEEARLASAPVVEGGAGKVVLLVGDNFDPEILDYLIYNLERENYNYEVFNGGEREHHLQLFVSGGEIPQFITEEFADDGLIAMISLIQRQHNLNIYAQNDTDTDNTLEAS